MPQQERSQPPIGSAPQGTVQSARDVVCVACKMPNGLILREMRKEEREEPVLGGGKRDVTYHEPTGEQVVIGGTTARFGAPPPILVNGGYRITRDVPKNIWDSWYSANKNSDLVKNHLIYAATYNDAKDWAKDKDGVRTGFEGIDPDNPGKHVRGITRADKPN